MENQSLPRGRALWAKVGIAAAALAIFFVLRADVLRTVLDSTRAQYQMRVVSPSLIEKYMASHSVKKLQIGAGTNNRADWLNTDIAPTSGQAYLDASVPFPLPDASIQYIFSEHVVEHIPLDKGAVMFKECYRVLAPGGRIRVATPNLAKLVALFNEHPSAEATAYLRDKEASHGWPRSQDPAAFILNMEMRMWGHQFVYSPTMLRSALTQAGFQEVTEYKAGQGGDPILYEMEVRPHTAYRDMNEYETMAFEAVRR